MAYYTLDLQYNCDYCWSYRETQPQHMSLLHTQMAVSTMVARLSDCAWVCRETQHCVAFTYMTTETSGGDSNCLWWVDSAEDTDQVEVAREQPEHYPTLVRPPLEIYPRHNKSQTPTH